MTIGGSLAVLAVGAILRYAVEDSWDAVDLEVVGLILMIVGAIGFVVGLLALVMSRGRSATPLGRHPFEGSRRPQRLSCDALRWVRERLRAAIERAVADTNGTPSSKEQFPTQTSRS